MTTSSTAGYTSASQLPAGPRVQYGAPLRIDDQTTVIPVSRRTLRGGSAPVGLYTIVSGETTWTPAVDGARIALIGVITGLIAATLGTAAVLKQPPWPLIEVRR